MQDPIEINVFEFEWDERNIPHAGAHGITPQVAEEVLDNAPLIFHNKEGMAGTHIMIGPDWSGRFWSIIIRPADGDPEGLWRPITGWPSDRPELRRYHGS